LVSSLLGLIVVTVSTSSTGALSPGPLTASTLAVGAQRGWKAGIHVAIGHTLVELPYVVALFYAYSTVQSRLTGATGLALGLTASIIVVFFGLLLIRDAVRGNVNVNAGSSRFLNPLIVGVVLTGLNVFFLVWWAGIGLVLVQKAIALGYTGLAVMYVSHVWMDYAWLSLVALAGYKGARSVGGAWYRYLLGALGIILLYFGVKIIFDLLNEYGYMLIG